MTMQPVTLALFHHSSRAQSMDALSHSGDCYVGIDHLLFNQRGERGRRCGSESEMQSL